MKTGRSVLTSGVACATPQGMALVPSLAADPPMLPVY
jgi:hypothetical protein